MSDKSHKKSAKAKGEKAKTKAEKAGKAVKTAKVVKAKKSKAVVPPSVEAVIEPPKLQPAAPRPAPAPSKRPETLTAPGKAAPKTAPKVESLLGAIEGQTLDQLEKLSKNVAETTILSQKLMADMIGKTITRQSTTEPDPFGITPLAGEIITNLTAKPDKLLDAQADLWRGFMDIWSDAAKQTLSGEAPPPLPKDKRFADPDWNELPYFDLLRRTYLHTSNWLTKLVADVEGLDEAQRRKAAFFTRQLTEAFSPANFALTNPVVLRTTLATGGENLLAGMRNLMKDLERGDGRLSISQTDFSKFKVGENVAATPGKVVLRSELFELLQFSPTTDTVYKTPLLIFPPWINKYYIMDLRADNSLIKWLVDQGHTVFVASWVNPDVSLSDKTFEDYMRGGVMEALDAVAAATGERNVNTVGYCIGGTLLGSTMAYMAQTNDDRVKSATFFACQLDFKDAGDLMIFTDHAALQYIEKQIEAEGGVLSAQSMADTFNALRSSDLIWSFVINNYMLGKDPTPFDLLYWNADQTRMPRTLHMTYLKEYYQENRLTRGTKELGGKTLDLGKVTTPVYMQSSREDHISPFRSVYRGAQAFGGPVRFIMAGSGHIAGVINAPAAKKYQHWLPPADDTPLPKSVDEWIAAATEFPGSWWHDWDRWLATRAGDRVPARSPGDGGLKVLGDAPGEYVLVRSDGS